MQFVTGAPVLLAPEFRTRFTAALKELLEKKHLYQSVKIETEFVARMAKERVANMEDTIATCRPNATQLEERFINEGMALLEAYWHPDGMENAFSGMPRSQLMGIEANHPQAFDLPTIYAVCPHCKAVWPHNPATEWCQFWYGIDEYKEQRLLLAYVCQSCKKEPTRFLVFRKGGKFQLCGRDPAEFVLTPGVLPKSVSCHFGDAQMAHNAGQTLAGIFLLRVFIEQFWRALPAVQAELAKDLHLRGDQIADIYAAGLPDDFRSRFPSLKDCYDALSGAMHSANASDEIFQNCSTDLIEHFDARRLFKIR
jgi:hypothetical protein